MVIQAKKFPNHRKILNHESTDGTLVGHWSDIGPFYKKKFPRRTRLPRETDTLVELALGDVTAKVPRGPIDQEKVGSTHSKKLFRL